MKIAVETFTEALYHEALPLLVAHLKEVALYQDRVPLLVDMPFYLQLQARNRLVCFTVRDDITLVGYAAFMAVPHPHYMTLFVARNDVIYMAPDYRGVSSVRLIRACEDHFQKIRPRDKDLLITWHAKMSNHFKDLLVRLGYDVQEVLLGKLL